MVLRTIKWMVLVMAVWSGSVNWSRGQLSITVGNYDLLPNTSGQQIELFVQNLGNAAVNVAGLSLNVQVADSGPAPGLGSIPGPHITSVDIVTGTVFQLSNNDSGQENAGSSPQFANWTTTTSSGTVSLGAGTTTELALVTLDTTGFSNPASWHFYLGSTINGPTKYFNATAGDILPSIFDGFISVPEPNAAVIVCGLLLGWVAVRRWPRRRNQGGN